MTVCAACGHESPEDAKFCPECGTPVAPAAAQGEQRTEEMRAELVASLDA
jgi:uncharacterized membrane protein YvbJ